MSHSTQRDWDHLEEPPKRRKEKFEKNPYSSLEADVRKAVLTTTEDWLVPKFIASCLRFGTSHVSQAMKKLADEGILAPLQTVPMNEKDDERVKLQAFPGATQTISAYVYDGRWVIGYYDRSKRDPSKTALLYERPSFLRSARVRGRVFRRTPTDRERAKLAAGYKYEPAPWDGRAFRLLRNGQAYVDACVAAGVEPNTGLPWDCACGRAWGPDELSCRCGKEKPRFLIPPEPKKCPNCGEVSSVNHWRRHKTKGLIRERWSCMQRIVDQVHGR